MEKALRYNKGKRKWHLVDFKALEPMIEVLEYGAHKYTIYEDKKGKEIKGIDIPIEDAHLYKVKISGANNWKKGFNDTDLLDCAMRHLVELMEGKIIDAESKKLIIGHLLCNALFISHFTLKNQK